MKALKSSRDLTPFSLRSFFSSSRSNAKLNLLESFYYSKEVYTFFLTLPEGKPRSAKKQILIPQTKRSLPWKGNRFQILLLVHSLTSGPLY